MSLLEQASQNLRAFTGLHRMQITPDWPRVRVAATLEADRRIRKFEDERAGRLEIYARRGAVESYCRRWRRSHVIEIHPRRFSQAFGGIQ